MIAILKRIKGLLGDPQNLIYIAFISVFFHYVITAVVIVATVVGLIINKNSRKKMFGFKGQGWLYAFTAFTALVALWYKNFLGVAASLGFFIIFMLMYYVRSTVTEKTYERCLDICCFAAIPLGIASVVEKVLCRNEVGYRCQLWFFNPNYFCAVLAAIIIICAFKATSHKTGVFWYYVCAVFGLIGMYTGGSLFALVEVFVGLCVLLILKRKHTMLAMFLLTAGICLIMVFFIPDLLPRLSESEGTTDLRIRIWNDSMLFIKENPLFGRGFLSYFAYANMYPEIYQTAHAHNFAIESLLSFGVIGTLLIVLLLWSYYRKVSECKELLRNNCATTLILSLSAAVLIHMTTDMTLMWIQTGVLYALILGGVGIDEKALDHRIHACALAGGISDNKQPKKE